MRIDGIDISTGTAGLRPEGRKPDTPEEAARQFEEVLIKQMLHTMTKDLFDSSIAGDDAPQWMGAYGEMQGDILSTELARQLGESGKLGISELLLKQWERQDGLTFPSEDSEEDGGISRPTNGQTSGQTNGQTSGQTNGPKRGPTESIDPINPYTEV